MSAAQAAITIAPEPANVAVARRFVTAWVTDVSDDRALVGDLELAVSELVTNAFEHGTGDAIDLAVAVRDGALELAVTSYGNVEQLDETGAWSLAEPTSVTGRGLAIVRAVADDVAVRRGDGSVTVVVSRRLPSPPDPAPAPADGEQRHDG